MDLFGNDDMKAPEPQKGERKSVLAYRTLIDIYGKSPGNRCGDCAFFYFKVLAKKYPKCQISGLAGASQNNDWSSRWAACAKFKQQKDAV